MYHYSWILGVQVIFRWRLDIRLVNWWTAAESKTFAGVGGKAETPTPSNTLRHLPPPADLAGTSPFDQH